MTEQQYKINKAEAEREFCRILNDVIGLLHNVPVKYADAILFDYWDGLTEQTPVTAATNTEAAGTLDELHAIRLRIESLLAVKVLPHDRREQLNQINSIVTEAAKAVTNVTTEGGAG